MAYNDILTFNLANNSTLRVHRDKIIATCHSKEDNTIQIYVAGNANPFEVKRTEYWRDYN